MPTTEPNTASTLKTKKDSSQSRGFWRVWLWVVFAFVALSAAWYTLIKIASENRPEEVPLPEKQAAPAQPQP